jgi:hypothetical protein
MIQYTFNNKNSLLNANKMYEDYNFVLSKILLKMNDYLDIISNNNVSIANLNFDNLICIKLHSGIISDVVKFDMNLLKFVGSNNFVYNVNENFNYMFNIVINKLQIKKKSYEPIKIANKMPEHGGRLQHINSKFINIGKPENIIIPPKTDLIPNELIEQKESQFLESIKEIALDQITPDIIPKDSNKCNELLKIMSDLTEQKKKENEKLEQLKKQTENNEEQLCKMNDNLNDKKREHFKNKEKEEENKNVYIANKKAYYLIKQDIKTNKINEQTIPILFKDVYPIYKFMDERKLLNIDDEYVHYVTIFNELYPKKLIDNKAFVPHNINYLTEEEQKKYEHIKSSNKDMISNFIESNASESPNKRKPLEMILSELDNNEFNNVSFDLN